MPFTKEDRQFLIDLVKTLLKPVAVQASNAGDAKIFAAGVADVIFQRNDSRAVATVVNAGANPAYINFGANAFAGTGILLNSGGSIVLGRSTDIAYTGSVWATSAAGTTLVFTEANMQQEEVRA
jgi:hypothetical protein